MSGFSSHTQFIVKAFDITYTKYRHQLITTLHFSDTPAQRVRGIFHVGHHFRQQMRNAFIHGKL
ncbi:Uncharacterised protein [Vibrio cholerae]|uniref:Uncharacterized protein n=1 Tax=Vibrio cholerae TaxID=666 RepID=A0A656AB11_VIBCL|nr:Uncharacterised protein [Vibrio cholerae]CSA69565.1 Uncharacterised protein [Vibrio cholerae]CSB18468.1 Uncharacterised protein [Vibrio cholerae]CSB31026.1 Uncharacterised protein [Vibrio cholerae]CSB96508.1 Uncharacterised protein [Vibrio cholerae]